MSGQASLSRMRATVRHRRAVARELARFGTGLLQDVHIERGGTFDVHAARQHALVLIRYGRHHHRVRRRLELDSRGRARWATPVGDWAETNPGRPWPHLDWHDRQYVRLGRRILATLEGQPSECPSCGGWGKPSEQMRADHAKHVLRRGPQPEMAALMRPCATCDGSGRNLRGRLHVLEFDIGVAVDRRVAVLSRHGGCINRRPEQVLYVDWDQHQMLLPPHRGLDQRDE